jgi:hypothetical protein
MDEKKIEKINKDEDSYIKPTITKHTLKLNEIILASCKLDSIGFTGPTGLRCKKGSRPCKEYSTS